jgi:hypothetical protein
MGNEMFTFMLFMMMNNKDRPIPFETVLSSSDMVPAPVRFAVQANTVQNVEASCLVEDKVLRAQVAHLISDHKIDAGELRKKYGRVYTFVQPLLPKNAVA